jgi:nucleoside-diphosphate-sugar epimerase
MQSMFKWLWFLRFFTVDLRFHFIHAADLARIADYLLENEVEGKQFVLGNAATSESRFMREVCAYFHKRVYFRIMLAPSFIKTAAKLFRKELSPWDLFCLDHRSFQYQTVNAATFGIPSKYQTLSGVLEDLK